MAAISLSVAVFLFWMLLGLGVLSLLYDLHDQVQATLLAPVVGCAITVLCVFYCNMAGLPVSRFGPILFLILLIPTVLGIFYLRSSFPYRSYLAFFTVFMITFLLTGRPMFEFGYDWLSYCNDDMANYCLSAQRFFNYGFSDTPSADDLVMGREYCQYYWFLTVPSAVRPGCDLILAWIMSLTRLSAHHVFMPVILSFHLLLVSTAGSLVCRPHTSIKVPLLTCLFVTLSVLSTAGTLFQLIAQVSGIGLLTGCSTLLLRSYSDISGFRILRFGLLVAILISSLLIVYPEVFPFLCLSYFIFVILGLWNRAIYIGPLLRALTIVSIFVLILLNRYLICVFSFMFLQITQHGEGITVSLNQLFPYYLIPSGFANLWGLQKLGGLSGEPWLSISILLGGFLFITSIFAALRIARQGHPAGCVCLSMYVAFFFLFVNPDGYKLFKLAMYIQPFLLGTVVIAWYSEFRRTMLQASLLALVLCWGIFTQFSYVKSSRGAGTSFAEIPEASQSRINVEFRTAISSLLSNKIMVDSFNPALAKFQALYLRGLAANFPCMTWFPGMTSFEPRCLFMDDKTIQSFRSLRQAIDTRSQRLRFYMHDPSDPTLYNPFSLNMIGRPSRGESIDYLVSSTSKQTVFNRFHYDTDEQRNFVVNPWKDVSNYLVFTPSASGQHYFCNFSVKPQVSFYQLENDPLLKGKTMAGSGRFFLFEVINPTPRTRLLLNFTASYKADGVNRLPSAVVIGSDRQAFPLMGRGSARVFSPPISPQLLEGYTFLGIDMRDEGVCFHHRTTGLMKLYGTHYLLDRRCLTGFTRDISLVSEDEYRCRRPPSKLESFPADLMNTELEFSGIYDDGWLSEASYFNLHQESSASLLLVRGLIPWKRDLDYVTELEVFIEGQRIARRSLQAGEFEIICQAPPGVGTKRVEFRFSNYQPLSKTDRRPAAALLRKVAFEEITSAVKSP